MTDPTLTFPSALGKPLLSTYFYADNLGNVDRSPQGFGFQTQKAIGENGFTTFKVSFVFDQIELMTFEDFYKDDLINGHKWFMMGVYTGVGYKEIPVRMLPEKYTSAMISPVAWEVSFSIETDVKSLISKTFYDILNSYTDIEDFYRDIGYLWRYANSYPSDYTTNLFKDDLDVSLWA